MQTTSPSVITVIDVIWKLFCLVGGGFLLSLAWKASGEYREFKLKGTEVHSWVSVLFSNHLPHIQQASEDTTAAVQKMDENLSGLREDFRTYFAAPPARRKK